MLTFLSILLVCVMIVYKFKQSCITNQTGDNLFFCCVHLRTSNAILREIRQMTTRVLHHGLKEKIAVVYIQDPVRGLHT